MRLRSLPVTQPRSTLSVKTATSRQNGETLGHPSFLGRIFSYGDARLARGLMQLPPKVGPEFFQHDRHRVIAVLRGPDYRDIAQGSVRGDVT